VVTAEAAGTQPVASQLVKKPRSVSPLGSEIESYPFSEAITVAPADSRALFAPANRGAASKPPRLIRHRRRFGAFHVRAGKHFSERKCASVASAQQRSARIVKKGHGLF